MQRTIPNINFIAIAHSIVFLFDFAALLVAISS